MANFDRGRDDVRVFDGGEDDEDIEGSRLPLLIVIALLVLAAFGAVVWLAYQRGVSQGHSEAPRIIAAEPGPARVAPSNPGGTPTPYTGLKIYQQPAPDDPGSATPPASITPAPPVAKPAARAVTTPAAVPVPAKRVTAAVAAPIVKPTASVVAAAPVAKPAAPPPAKPAAVASRPPLQLKPTAEDKPAAAPAKPVAASPPAVKTAGAVPAPPAATAPAATAPAAAGAMLQIGSYKSQAEAEAAWTAYKAKHASAVGGLSSNVQSADLGARGTWYRLRIAAGSRDEAVAVCQKLKAEGGACILAH